MFDKEVRLSFRGCQMLIIMKCLTVAASTNDHTRVNVVEYASYIISASTSLFGPWLSYTEHLRSFGTKKKAIVSCIKLACIFESAKLVVT